MLKTCYNFSCILFKSHVVYRQRVMTVVSNNIHIHKRLSHAYSTNKIDNNEKNSLLDFFVKYFDKSEEHASAIIESNKHLMVRSEDDIVKSLKYCSKFKISSSTVLQNMWLLDMRSDIFIKRLNAISKIKLDIIDHGVPFIKLSTKTLNRLCYRIIAEETKIPQGNRLYYLSNEMKIDPMIISQYISKRTFVYIVPFEDLKEILYTLLDVGVTAESILNDLWVFRYKPNVVKERLEKLQSAGRRRLMPWMVKCPKRVFERSINLTVITKSLLGDNKSVINYLAERLNCTADVVDEMSKKIPYIRIVRVAKVKNTLDYIFSQGYAESDIIKVPRVLAHSIKTMDTRLKKLRAIGVNPKNLLVLCKSQRDFEKYLESVKRSDNQIDHQAYLKEKQSFVKSK